MKQISSFMTEISDEFKTVVVEAIHSLCLKFPRKHHVLMTFLANMLRNEVGTVTIAMCIIIIMMLGRSRLQEGYSQHTD